MENMLTMPEKLFLSFFTNIQNIKFSFSHLCTQLLKYHICTVPGSHQPRPIMFIWMCCCCCPGGTPRICATSLGFLTPTVPPYLRNSVSYSSVSRVRLLAAWIRGTITLNRNASVQIFVHHVDVTHQTAPGSPGGGPGPTVVCVALAGVNQRLLPGHPRPGRPQGGAGPRDGGQGPHPAIVHGEASPARLRLLKWVTMSVESWPAPARRVSHCASTSGRGKVDHQGQMNFI